MGGITLACAIFFAGWHYLVRMPVDAAEKVELLHRRYVALVGWHHPAKGVTPSEAMEWQAAGQDLVWLDVRTPDERAVSTLPGAMDLEEYRTLREDGLTHRTVVYCTMGYRSAEVAAALTEDGVDAYNLEGGILAWTHQGGGLSRGGQPTSQVHVFSAQWDLAAPGIDTVW